MVSDLVSVIMPSYNCGAFVAESIRSVLAQTYPYWELLFIDDGSTDDTSEIVGAFRDNRIRCFRNEKNDGAARSRNRALREAKGRWIAFLDADDLWEPNKLEKQIDFMKEAGCAFSYTCYQEIDEKAEPLGVEVSGPRHISKAGMYAYCWLGCLTVMYDAQKVGLIQILDIQKNNDYAMWLRVIGSVDCYLLDECLAKYRRGRRNSISSHGYTTMVKWHYKLWHEAEGMNCFAAVFMTCVNMWFGIIKKLAFVRRVNRDVEMDI